MSVTGFNRKRREAKRYEQARQSQAGASQGPETQAEPEEITVAELREEAKAQGIAGYGRMRKVELLEAVRG